MGGISLQSLSHMYTHAHYEGEHLIPIDILKIKSKKGIIYLTPFDAANWVENIKGDVFDEDFVCITYSSLTHSCVNLLNVKTFTISNEHNGFSCSPIIFNKKKRY